jgi:hypothetical protein
LSTEELGLIEKEKDILQDDPIALISDDEKYDSGCTQKQVTEPALTWQEAMKYCVWFFGFRGRNTDAQELPSDGEDNDHNNFHCRLSLM